MVRKRPFGAPCGAFGGTHGAVGALRMAGMPGRAGHDDKGSWRVGRVQGAWRAGRYRRRGVPEGDDLEGFKEEIWCQNDENYQIEGGEYLFYIFIKEKIVNLLTFYGYGSGSWIGAVRDQELKG